LAAKVRLQRSSQATYPRRGDTEFEDEDIDYELSRWVEYQKQTASDYQGEIIDEDVSLTFTKSDGTRGTRNNPQDSIEQILPHRLSSLFF